MLRATAVISTDASVRYAKQLLAHLGHKVTVEPLEGQPQAGRLVFAYGVGTVLPVDGRLILDATADDEESLARVEDVIARHLIKFGARRELTVTWEPVSEAASTEAGVPSSEAGVPSSEAGVLSTEAGVPSSEAGLPADTPAADRPPAAAG